MNLIYNNFGDTEWFIVTMMFNATRISICLAKFVLIIIISTIITMVANIVTNNSNTLNTFMMIHDIMIIVSCNKRTISIIWLITDEFTSTFDNILRNAIEMWIICMVQWLMDLISIT